MLPKPCFPPGRPPDPPFRQNCLQLAESVRRLSTALDEPVYLAGLRLPKTPLPDRKKIETAANSPMSEGRQAHDPITALINSMSKAVGRASLAQKAGRRAGSGQRLSVPEILSHQSKGFHPRTTIRASRRDQALSRIRSDNLLSSRASLVDADSALEMVEFVTDHILAPQTGKAKPGQRCLAQKALALLLAD